MPPVDPARAAPASFRDPAGFIYHREGTLYRRVTAHGLPAYHRLMESGLYDELVGEGLLISHVEATHPPRSSGSVTLRPELVPFVSYPYEWCFGQLKDAALATLEICRRAIGHDMWLKDASAYNIQFVGSSPVLIDTLSLADYPEGAPWPAYQQFCQHFLVPLALMAYVDIGLSQLLRVHLDGVPLDLANRLLPLKTRLHPALLAHVHLHAAAQRQFADGPPRTKDHSELQVSRVGLLGLLDSLRGAIQALHYEPKGTVWSDYYGHTNYSNDAMEAKHRTIDTWIGALPVRPERAWDVGANNGEFSRILSARGIFTVAWDIDPAAVEQNWRRCRQESELNLLPLVQDLTNPSPDMGWAGRERDGLLARGPADLVLALALIHHLAITNNVPLGGIAALFAELCSQHLIVEWVEASDSQARRLLARHTGEVVGYDRANFRDAFSRYFTIEAEQEVEGAQRTLYLLRRRTNDDGQSSVVFSATEDG